MPRILGMPRWLAFSVLTILVWGAWGVVSKVASEGVDADTNQVFFTFGLLPLIAIVWRSPRNAAGGAGRRVGIAWAFLTGILGGTGNIAFFHALVIDDGKITKAFYPVFPPDKNAEDVIAWLQASR